MKKIIYFSLISLLFCNCAHQITRSGYHVRKSDYKFCEVAIQKFKAISDTNAKQIGEISLGESGMSSFCSEEDAINILKNEACAIDADLIIIVEEKRPDFWSTCYRCRAKFYKFDTSTSHEVMKDDQEYNQDKLQQRVSDDRKRNTTTVIISIAAGILSGLLLFY